MDKLLQSHFLGLYCMVLADGIIEATELETLYRIGTENYGLSPEEINHAIKEAGTSFIEPQSMRDKIRFLHDMCCIVLADNKIDESELVLLRKYVIKMGFLPEHVEEIISFMLENVKNGKSVTEILTQIQ